jgi:hypothetical protein
LELFEVKRAFALHFRISEEAIKVTVHAQGEFLLQFANLEDRRAALMIQGALKLGSVSFLLMPWSRLRRATASSLPFKVRVCLEGVPDHAWDIESVKPLFAGVGLIDSIDDLEMAEQETACLRLWVWMEDVNALATRGVLKLEEPVEVDSPLTHILGDAPERTGPLKMVDHPILLHLDKVIDHDPPAGSHASIHSNVSGVPSDGSSASAETVTWGYRWVLGVEARNSPPPPPRGSVHSRLQFPRRDGGDGGGDGAVGGRHARGSGGTQSGRERPLPASGGSSSRYYGGGGSSTGGQQHASEEMPVVTHVGAQDLQGGAQQPTCRMVGHMEAVVPSLTIIEAPSSMSAEVVGREQSRSRESLGADGAAAQTLGLVSGDGSSDRSLEPSLEPLIDLWSDLPMQSTIVASSKKSAAEMGLMGLIMDIQAMGEGLGDEIGHREVELASAQLALHSTQLQQETVAEFTESADSGIPAQSLESFLGCAVHPAAPPLLPSPAAVQVHRRPAKPATTSDTEVRSSGRLAAKPTSKLSALDKAKLVLLKKSGVLAEDGIPTASDLQKYRGMYTRALPPYFISAVTALVDAVSPNRKKTEAPASALVAAA